MAFKSTVEPVRSTSVKPSLVLTNPIHLISFGLGTGLSPWAPGTVGTLVGFPLFASLMAMPMWAQIVVLAVMFVAGIACCQITGKAVGVPDHGGIVIDEIVSFATVLVFVPATFLWWCAAFVAFRFFDILKVWPANWVDKSLKNGFGVMLDDLVAALFSIVVLVGAQSLF